MGRDKELSIMKDDYRRIILKKLYEIEAVKTCPFCGVEFLTGKEESYIYAIVTNEFKKEFGDKYDNDLMKSLINEALSERFFEHDCDK